MTGSQTSRTQRGDRVDYLLARLEILDCINRIARGVDRLDADYFRTGYHPDAILDFGTHVGTPDEHIAFFFDLHERMQTAHAHTICNHTCEVDGDVAHAETYFIFASENRSGTPTSIAGGRYVDRFERRDGRWAIAVRKCLTTWNLTPDSEVSQQIAAAFAGVGHNGRDRDDVSYQRPLDVSTERRALAIA